MRQTTSYNLAQWGSSKVKQTLREEVFIDYNGPGLFKLDSFMAKCSDLFLRLYRQPLVDSSKYVIGYVIGRLKKSTTVFVWCKDVKMRKVEVLNH